MTSEYAAQRGSRRPTHPGEVLRDVLVEFDMDAVEIAKLLQITPSRLRGVLSADINFTPDLADSVGEFVGNGPAMWLRMQQIYDEWHSSAQPGTAIHGCLIMSDQVRDFEDIPFVGRPLPEIVER